MDRSLISFSHANCRFQYLLAVYYSILLYQTQTLVDTAGGCRRLTDLVAQDEYALALVVGSFGAGRCPAGRVERGHCVDQMPGLDALSFMFMLR
jgi:hypothetical protein